MDYNFRIFDFNIFNEKKSNESSYDEDGNIIESDEEEVKTYKDNAKFMIQMFGVNEKGETCSIIAQNYKPFFYKKLYSIGKSAYITLARRAETGSNPPALFVHLLKDYDRN